MKRFCKWSLLMLGCSLLWLMLSGYQVSQAGWFSQPAELVMTVKCSPDSTYVHRFPIRDRRLTQAFRNSGLVPADGPAALPRAYLSMKEGQSQFEYTVDHSGRVFADGKGQIVQLSAWGQHKLQEYLEAAEKQHYGESLPWQEVNRLFPRMETAQVIDLETGLSFRVQRRAGSQHADVQPLTAADTRTMKEAYHGKWSWKRRAVIVEAGGRRIAASMNGMPHGAGAIRGNDFSGHFCVHFQGSTTHGKRKLDLGHQLMVSKAAGKANEIIQIASPVRLVSLFVAALDQQDLNLVQRMLDPSKPEEARQLLEQLEEVEEICILGKQNHDQPVVASQQVEMRVRLLMHYRSVKQPVRREVEFIVRREKDSSRWTLDPAALISSF